ncbi:MAG: aminotransferase class V-fold PLP-dependent enzyme, partial [Alicyclobacillaceae bacterium]|nr:aminotransferase class V-fold PLP-dependent enzyme [Alicyclobacillaceae bacterium]
MIYLDNAASSWPKPPQVSLAVAEAIDRYGANPGRGTHSLAMRASRTIAETRAELAGLIGAKNPDDIIFTHNATEALNLAIFGVLTQGDHAITTTLEHNSVRRPLEALRRRGIIDLTYVPAGETGVDPDDIRRAMRANTKLVVVTHASNVLGTVIDIETLIRVVHEHGALCLVDASQTVGTIPLDVELLQVDLMAFPGHKGLFGPQGTGALYIRPGLEVTPLLYGGTGGYSEDVDQPPVRPLRYESGTPNTPGIAGLGAGVRFVRQTGIERIRTHNHRLIQRLYDGLRDIPGMRIVGPSQGQPRADLLSFSCLLYPSA